MTLVLGENRYGKSRVRLMKVTRGTHGHAVAEWTLDIWLEGDFVACFQDGDNSNILPTDTMKNSVYSLARSSSATCMEIFAKELVTHFVSENPHVHLAGVHIESTPWKQVQANGSAFPSTLTHSTEMRETATVVFSAAAGYTVTSGFDQLWLLKTANSAFTGFRKDPLTTLKESSSRLLGTLAKAEWKYDQEGVDFVTLRAHTTTALIKAFAGHDSLSVQQTLYAMAKKALETVPNVVEMRLFMPNKHCNLVDLSAFGQDNPDQIYVPTDEPHGSIEAVVRRGD